jgi:hypothetical protein
MKQKQKNKQKVNRLVDAISQTRGRYMSLHIETSKSNEVISCKSLGIKDKYVVVQDRNNGNRKRSVAKESLRAMHCGDLVA